jgi:hypothetical protein
MKNNTSVMNKYGNGVTKQVQSKIKNKQTHFIPENKGDILILDAQIYNFAVDM